MASLRLWLKKLHADTNGAMAVEKILIIALISVPIVLVLWAFRQQLKSWFSDASSQLQP